MGHKTLPHRDDTISLFDDFDEEILEKAKELVAQNLAANHYTPLKEIYSRAIREHYRAQCRLSVDGGHYTLVNGVGTILSRGYERIVIGDYGAYVECSKEQINKSKLMSLFPGEPPRAVKYIWLVTNDMARTKVYEQRDTVGYADYKVGMYYFSPDDVVTIRE